MELRLSDVIAALSHALDLTGGQPRGHAQRSCLVGMRLAEHAGLPAERRASLFYALLLKDAGCSSTSAKVAALYGADDTAVKPERRSVDFASTPDAVLHVFRVAGRGGSVWRRPQHVARLLTAGRARSRSIVELRCERGAEVARDIGLGETAATAILHVDERWDGRGHPAGLAGEEISVEGRILGLAQSAVVFWQQGGRAAACAMARRRSGTWFDPALVEALCALEDDEPFWDGLAEPDVAPLEPEDAVAVADEARIDRVAEAFARVIDAKSPYTASHSDGVAEVADGVAELLGVEPAERAHLRRAALLHDLGKLGISNRILDKPGELSPAEWLIVLRHPEWSEEILARAPALRPLAATAAAHHERLDGSGYHRGLAGEQLDLAARILAVADVAEALGADRPYRRGLPADAVLDAIRVEAGPVLDARAFEALEGFLPAWQRRRDAAAA